MTQISFENYELSDSLMKAINLLGFKAPTKVQQEVMPLALDRKDLVVKSQTGSGKTAAFAIPICELLDWEENKPQALVLTPTRELAIQVKEDFFNIGRLKRIRPVALYGKSPFHLQVKELKQKSHVIVGTPGRVMDHLERGTWDPKQIKYLVIDEADEMLRMGFIEQVQDIIKMLPSARITMLFSATMPEDIQRIAKSYMKNPVEVVIEAENKSHDKIEQVVYKVKEKDKIALLQDLTVVENPKSCIIFCNTKQQVDDVSENLINKEYTCAKIHGGMEQCDRLQVMEDFKKGYFRYLVATDVAARGIDINHISHVINYDIPEKEEGYVHRIGRTGRASRTGKAITFVTPGDTRNLENIEKYIGKEISKGERPHRDTVEAAREAFLIKINKRLEDVDTKGVALNKEIMKLHINAGKKTKMRPVDIVGTLCNIEGMSADDIGIITILDVSTFVEVLNNKGESVLNALQTTPIKGRLRRVTKAEK